MENVEKYIPGYEGRWLVSNMGYVRRVGKDKRHYGALNNRGYRQVHLTDNGGKDHTMLVSRLVAEAFLSNPEGRTQVDHINTDRSSTMSNRVDNLRWVWPRENAANLKTYYNRRSPRLFARPKVKAAPARAILPDGKVIYANTMKELANLLGCAPITVSRCYHGDQPFYDGNIRIEPLPRQEQLTLF